MKKFILGGIAVLAIAAVAVVNVNLGSKSSDLSTISLANVEALATGESSDGYCTMHIACYDKYGNPTGKYSASSYTGPGCKGAYHSHSCTSCNS
jgi:hypothetical protein